MGSCKSGHSVCNPSCYTAQGLIKAGASSLLNDAKAPGVFDAVASPVLAWVIRFVIIIPNASCDLNVVRGSVWQ